MGYQRNAKKCKEKFENVHKYYKKTKDGRAGRQDGKSYRFFSQLEALYGGQQTTSAQLESSNAAVAAAASLLTGVAPTQQQQQQLQLANKPSEDYNASAQRPSEVSTGVTLSDSSEDDYDEPESGEAVERTSLSKKRKRMETSGKSGTSAKLDFFETLMKNLLDKQESLQKKFLEFMERREQDRQVREEAWRRQENVRLAREHDLRTQEHALAATRDAALVAFLQKITGQTLQLPQLPTRPPLAVPPLVVPPSIDSVVAAAAQKQQQQHQQQQQQQQAQSATPPPAPPASATPTSQALVLASAADADHDKDSSIDPNSKRWPKPEVLTLIKLRSDMEPRFQEAGPKGPLWEEISQGMACLGYNRNQKRCKEKWENINKYFRKTKESNKKRPENAKTCPYFHQLDTLYRSGVLGTPSNKQLAKVGDSPPVDYQALPLAHRFEAVAKAGAAAEPGAEMAKLLPAAAEAAQNAASSGNGTSSAANANAPAAHFFSSPENGSSADRGAKQVSESSL